MGGCPWQPAGGFVYSWKGLRACSPHLVVLEYKMRVQTGPDTEALLGAILAPGE